MNLAKPPLHDHQFEEDSKSRTRSYEAIQAMTPARSRFDWLINQLPKGI